LLLPYTSPFGHDGSVLTRYSNNTGWSIQWAILLWVVTTIFYDCKWFSAAFTARNRTTATASRSHQFWSLSSMREPLQNATILIQSSWCSIVQSTERRDRNKWNSHPWPIIESSMELFFLERCPLSNALLFSRASTYVSIVLCSTREGHHLPTSRREDFATLVDIGQVLSPYRIHLICSEMSRTVVRRIIEQLRYCRLVRVWSIVLSVAVKSLWQNVKDQRLFLPSLQIKREQTARRCLYKPQSRWNFSSLLSMILP